MLNSPHSNNTCKLLGAASHVTWRAVVLRAFADSFTGAEGTEQKKKPKNFCSYNCLFFIARQWPPDTQVIFYQGF